jgi:tetratricopeptide (TPR) repeat protein
VVLWDWLFFAPASAERGRWTATWRRRWPLYAGLAAAASLVAVIAPGTRAHSVGFGLEGWTSWTYLLTESRVLVHYLRLAVWPAPLVLDPYWPMVRSLGAVVAPMAALTLLLALTIVGLARRHPVAMLGAWFFVILAPTSSVIPIVTEIAAEHRMYLPLGAIAAGATIGAYLLGEILLSRLPSSARSRKRIGQAIGFALLAAVVVVLGVETRARNRDYASDERIWRDTIQKQPDNPRARTALGADLVIAGRYQEAEEQLQAAVGLDPASPMALSNLGAAEYGLGQIDASIGHLERALALRPDYVDAHHNLAESYVARRQDALAVPHYLRALPAQPDNLVVLNHFGLILAASPDDTVRNGAMSLDLAERAVRLTSRHDAASLSTLGAALAELDRFDEAAAVLREAIALPTNTPALVAEFDRRLSAYGAHRKVRLPGR